MLINLKPINFNSINSNIGSSNLFSDSISDVLSTNSDTSTNLILLQTISDSIFLTESIISGYRFNTNISEAVSIPDQAQAYRSLSDATSDVVSTTGIAYPAYLQTLNNSLTINSSDTVIQINAIFSNILLNHSESVVSSLKTSVTNTISYLGSTEGFVTLSANIDDNILSITLASPIVSAVASSSFDTSQSIVSTLSINLSNNISALTTVITPSRYNSTFSESVILSTISSPNAFLGVSDAITVFSGTIEKALYNLLESITFNHTTSDANYILESVTSAINYITTLKFINGYTFTETVNITEAMSSLLKVVILNTESLRINGTSVPKRNLISQLISTVNLIQTTGSAIVNSVSSSIDLSISLSVIKRIILDLIDELVIEESITPSSILVFTTSDSLSTSDDIFSNYTKSGVLEELILIFPGSRTKDIYLSYLYSPENSTITNYTNYDFDGGVVFDGKYFFFNKEGIYKYGGLTDDGELITSEITTSSLSFGTSSLKNVPSIYLGITTTGDTIFKVRVDGKGEFIYKLNKHTSNLQTQKVSLGKGLLGRYFQFEIITDSDVFNLDTIEFLPIELKRKL